MSIWAAAIATASLAGSAEDLAAGMAAQRAGDADAAIVSYSACLEGDSDNVPCHWESGWSYWTKGDW